ncbi:hypothetical protein RJT34_25790 [Clitoria ternatea]|uniref:Uncharacterized protein n=1 Tax=Clitoria ternatea TaxID=43366 RepID=A0AAN9FX42_CLITE
MGFLSQSKVFSSIVILSVSIQGSSHHNELHRILGTNKGRHWRIVARWAAIALYLPQRTDNDKRLLDYPFDKEAQEIAKRLSRKHRRWGFSIRTNS